MRATDFIEHPEGGRYREVYRSSTLVTSHDCDGRSALTHIYFSLRAGEVSRFHRLSSDEVWSLYRGQGLRLVLWDGESTTIEEVKLSAASEDYCHVVPAHRWQAAASVSGTVLVGCTVAPGFEYAGFELLERGSTPARKLLAHHPELAPFIEADR